MKLEFPFVYEALERLQPQVKKMFGCTALYVGEKIVLIMRLKDNHTDDNGLWLATVPEHHESLQKEFPSMRSIRVFGPGPSSWQNLPLEEADFEAAAERACELVLKGDPRIGKVPASRRKTTRKKSAK